MDGVRENYFVTAILQIIVFIIGYLIIFSAFYFNGMINEEYEKENFGKTAICFVSDYEQNYPIIFAHISTYQYENGEEITGIKVNEANMFIMEFVSMIVLTINIIFGIGNIYAKIKEIMAKCMGKIFKVASCFVPFIGFILLPWAIVMLIGAILFPIIYPLGIIINIIKGIIQIIGR